MSLIFKDKAFDIALTEVHWVINPLEHKSLPRMIRFNLPTKIKIVFTKPVCLGQVCLLLILEQLNNVPV